MKAILLINHGGPEMLRYGEVPDPTASPGEVVDIHAASVNAADTTCGSEAGDIALAFPAYSWSRFLGGRQSNRSRRYQFHPVTQC
jgi:NADPH:quinone reductase-like Zn-dependent oxidoreductase